MKVKIVKYFLQIIVIWNNEGRGTHFCILSYWHFWGRTFGCFPASSLSRTAHVNGKSWTESDWLNHTIEGFLQQHFRISATSFCIFATRFIYAEAQRNSFDPKHITWKIRGPNWPPLIQKCHVTDAGPQLTSFDPINVTLPTLGPNRPFICLD